MKPVKFGICLYHKKLLYSNIGYLKWMPYIIQKIIVRIWNFISCRSFGHSYFPDFKTPIYKNKKIFKYEREICCDCLKIRKVNKI